jgi:hypothetical protein
MMVSHYNPESGSEEQKQMPIYHILNPESQVDSDEESDESESDIDEV